MPCDELTIHLYVDGELPPEEAAACRRHLATCEACRELQRQIAWLHGVLRPTAAKRRSRRLGWLVAPATLAASLVLVWRLASVGPLPAPTPGSAAYHVELAGAGHTVSVHGCELIQLAVGEDQPKTIDLERARIQ